MKKSLLAFSALAAMCTAAYAQDSSVTFYGVLDVGIGTVSKSYNVDPQFPFSVTPVGPTKTSVNNSVTGMFNGAVSDSRWGIRGSEDMGGGLKTFFVVESGFNVPTGTLNSGTGCLATNAIKQTTACANTSLNGQLFNRQANVGLSDGNMGSVALGRNYGPIYDIASTYDPVQNADLFSPIGFSGTYGGGGGISEDTRVDNSVKYTNKISDFNVGALYKFGGVAGNSSAQSGYALNLGYEPGRFGVQFAYEVLTDGIKTSSLTAPTTTGAVINGTAFDTTAYFLAARYLVTDEATIKAGWERFTLKAASDNLGTSKNPTVTTLYGLMSNVTSYTGADQPVNIYFVGGDYNFTPAFNLAIGYYDLKFDSFGTTPAGETKYYSLLADYHFSKRTDVYAGYMGSTYGGALYPSSQFNASNAIYAVGVRTRF